MRGRWQENRKKVWQSESKVKGTLFFVIIIFEYFQELYILFWIYSKRICNQLHISSNTLPESISIGAIKMSEHRTLNTEYWKYIDSTEKIFLCFHLKIYSFSNTNLQKKNLRNHPKFSFLQTTWYVGQKEKRHLVIPVNRLEIILIIKILLFNDKLKNLAWQYYTFAEVGASIIQIDKSIIDNYRSSNFSSNYRFTKNIDLSITNWQNRLFNGSIIIDLGKKDRALAFIDLNYRIIEF